MRFLSKITVLALSVVALSLLASLLALASTSAAQDSQDTATAATATAQVVVELFTSQGCGNSPPADAILRGLSARDDIVALSWSVDYWDRFGWTDTEARPDHARRQRAYNKKLQLGGVYTPQMIVDGRYNVVGSRRRDVQAIIDEARSAASGKIRPTLTLAEDHILLNLPAAAPGAEGAAIRLVWYQSETIVDITDGQNKGRRLSYANSVKHSEIVDIWDGSPRQISVDRNIAPDADGVAVLIQKGFGEGDIVGTAALSLAPPSLSGR